LIVTTSDRPSEETLALARRLAEELGAPCAPRRGSTVRALLARHSATEALVVGADGLRLAPAEGQPFFYHPSMALVRIKGLIGGGRDAMLNAAVPAEGDVVVDCTAGLCSDSLVFSYAVGERGRVVALEAVPVLHAIVREGLRAYETGVPDVDRAMRAIEPVLAGHEDYLAGMPDKSADIVYFDPMFEKPVTASSAMVPLRELAVHRPLTEASVLEAKRVARKRVVLKDHRDSGRFERLGFRTAGRSSSAVAYGVIDI